MGDALVYLSIGHMNPTDKRLAIQIAADHRRAGIFGSYARGEQLPYILTFMDLCNASLIIFTSPSRFLP